MPNRRHEAFSAEYQNIALELLTEVELFNPVDTRKRIKILALWDTGATISSITPEVQKKLDLQPVDSAIIEGANSLERCDLVLVNVELPNALIVSNVKSAVCVFSPSDMEFIIGMDIIKFGDFLISNSQGKTFFSFASPPLPIRLNLVDQVKQIN